MTRDQARAIVLNYFEGKTIAGYPVRLLDELTREETFGWVFFYTAATPPDIDPLRNLLIVGNAPLIVDRAGGSIHHTGTALPIEHYVEAHKEFKRSRNS